MQYNTAQKTQWNTAIYVRISTEERLKSFSESIANQKSILTSYANHNNLNIFKIYADDGYTGGNFNRPSFKNMINDIDKGLVNCVLVKDLSRFGREHIEGDYYLEKYFPNKGVRLISLHERLDSFKDPGRMNSIEIPLINIFNEQYLRQVSNATKASLKIKRKEGKFVGSIVPYGYMRSREDKYKLVIDNDVKHNVESIFKWYLSNESFTGIVMRLNAMNLLSPTAYRKMKKGQPYSNNRWTIGHIKAILQQPIYIGDMVQGRTKSYNYKVKKRTPIDREQWDIVENTHEPIISKSDFKNVQVLLNSKSKQSNSKNKIKPSILSGFLYCYDCGKKLVRSTSTYNGKVYHKFICPTYKKYGVKACGSHLIQEDALLEILLCTINTKILSVMDIEKALLKNKEANIKKQTAILQKEYNNTKIKVESIMSLKVGLYSDYKLDVISFEEYVDMKENFEKQYSQKNEQLQTLEKQILDLSNNNIIENEVIMHYKKYCNGIIELDRKIIVVLIDKIIVSNDKSINIQFKFQDEIKKYSSIFVNE